MLPDLPGGQHSQIQSQKIKVHHKYPGALSQGGGDGGQGVLIDQRGQIQLVIAHILEHGGDLPRVELLHQLGHGIGSDPAVVHGQRLPVHGGGHLGDLIAVQPHQVEQRLADDGIQGQQDQNGKEGPQTPAHGVDLLPLIEALDLHIVALPVLAVLLLQLLHLAGEQVHLDHTLFALDGQGEEDDLDNQCKKDQGNTVAVGKAVKKVQQPAERGQDVVHNAH